ncbi:MAG TPA: hypothetical protein VN851_03795 [Thermoanaerobaculia bacterium]|nr:hypothetical protein [Thermoanaerobaculia bacterium]
MDYVLAAIVGWCGTGWPIRFPHIGGGTGGFDPDFPWPPNCWACGKLWGSLAAILTVAALGSHFANEGLLATVTLSFFGGSFGSSLVSGLGRMVTRSK